MNRSILMLEHDDDDRYITQAVFDEHNVGINLNFVLNRDELFAQLEANRKSSSSRPSLILLNYHTMPSTAVDVIRELKTSMHFNDIPVVVLSGSVHQDIVGECYAAGASSFIQKPAGSKDTDEKIMSFVKYWFKTVELP